VAQEYVQTTLLNSKGGPELEHLGLVVEEEPPGLGMELMVGPASRQQLVATPLSTGQAALVGTTMALELLIPAAVEIRMVLPTGAAEGRIYR
jgi:hypothetical protein